jgi:DNA-binding winged helix-turn-helix (wHTH) protein
MDAPSTPRIRFGVFELDATSGELRKQGRRIRLPDQAFQVLQLLLDGAGEVVTREDLRKRLWPTATAGDFDGGLNNAMEEAARRPRGLRGRAAVHRDVAAPRLSVPCES